MLPFLLLKLTKPVIDKILSDKKRIFIYRLSRTWRNVECAFETLINKLKTFNKPKNGNLDLSVLNVDLLYQGQ